jgi:peptidyl-tRNA hydrolase
VPAQGCRTEKFMKRIKIYYRKSLKMSPGKLASQCGHATVGLYKKDPREHWSCIVLYATDEEFTKLKAEQDCYVVTR